jgi:hypothetical protein
MKIKVNWHHISSKKQLLDNYIQWSLMNPDAINPDASSSGRLNSGIKYMKTYHI